jgi:endonuclease III
MNAANNKLRRAMNLSEQTKANSATQAKQNLKDSIHKVLNITSTLQQNKFRPVIEKTLNFVSEKANSKNLVSKARNILSAYDNVGGNANGLPIRKKIAVLKKLVQLMSIYSKSHGNAFYTAAFNKSLGRFSFLTHFVKHLV